MDKPAFTINDMPPADVKKANTKSAEESVAIPLIQAIINWARKGESREKVLFIDLPQFTPQDVRDQVLNFISMTNDRDPSSLSVYYIRWHDDPYPVELARFRLEVGVCARVSYVSSSTDRKVMRPANCGFAKDDALNKQLEDGVVKWLTDCSNDDKQHEWAHSFGTVECPQPVRQRAAQLVHEANQQSNGAFYVLTFPLILAGDRGMGGPAQNEYRMRLRRERAIDGQLVPKATDVEHVRQWLPICVKYVEDNKKMPPYRFVLPHEIGLWGIEYVLHDLARNRVPVHEWKDQNMALIASHDNKAFYLSLESTKAKDPTTLADQLVADLLWKARESARTEKTPRRLGQDRCSDGNACMMCSARPSTHGVKLCGHLSVCEECGDSTEFEACTVCNIPKTGLVRVVN